MQEMSQDVSASFIFHPLTCLADEQRANQPRVDVPDRVHLGRVRVGEALGVAAGGAVLWADVPDVLVVSSREHGIVLLLMTGRGVIVPRPWWKNTQCWHLKFPSAAAVRKTSVTGHLDKAISCQTFSWARQIQIFLDYKVFSTRLFMGNASSGLVPMPSVSGITPPNPLSHPVEAT